jgi:hypothetical protein
MEVVVVLAAVGLACVVAVLLAAAILRVTLRLVFGKGPRVAPVPEPTPPVFRRPTPPVSSDAPLGAASSIPDRRLRTSLHP